MCRYLIGFRAAPHKQRTTVDPNAESTVVPKTRRSKAVTSKSARTLRRWLSPPRPTPLLP